MKYLYTILIALFLILSFYGCSSPKEGCGMDPSVNYDRVDYSKKQKKKRGKSELFSKSQRKRMKKRK